MLGRPRFASVLALVSASLTTAASPAQAYDVLASPCPSSPLTCGTGAIGFSKIDALPIQFHVDTGWVPQGSPVQVHLFADVFANTHVSLTGALVTSWPQTLSLAAPGDPMDGKSGGDFGFDYGADFGAEGKVSISVAGQSYSWQGALPFVPQFNLQVKADQGFDAWGYAAGITLMSTSQPQQLASIGLSSIIGGSIPGIDGGFALDVAIELDATYTTERIVMDTTDGKAVAGGPITSAMGTSSVPFLNGGSVELDVHPEGRVDYGGVVHLIPTFWVSLLGNKWNIPIVDVPVSFPIASTNWIFKSERVHFPLPDLALPVTELDFGDVEVGFNKTLEYQLWNAGEAKAAATMTTSDATTFPLVDESTGVDPGKTYLAGVEFIPATEGPFSGQIVVASNDPKAPMQIVLLKGVGTVKASPPPPVPPHTTTPAPQANQVGDCGCRAAGSAGGPHPAVGVAMLIAAAAGLRRRRRSA